MHRKESSRWLLTEDEFGVLRLSDRRPNVAAVLSDILGVDGMTSITEIADKFFVACETGKGWDGCKVYCTPSATFSAQAEPLIEVRTLQQYCDWMKGLLGFIPDGRYDLKSFATDEKRRNVSAYAVFLGTH